MPNKSLHMGSLAWAEEVFRSPPVRKLKGHARRTQSHHYYSLYLGQRLEVQGRNEACSALALEYLTRLGLLTRLKAQPFVTTLEEFGSEIVPDFLAEGSALVEGKLFTIETKSARFLTRVKHLELDHFRCQFAEFGISYLIWTDQRPLNHSVRHNLINMRGGANRDVTTAEQEALAKWVTKHSYPDLARLYADGFDLDCLYAAAWNCRVFFPITRPLLPDTKVTDFPQENLKAVFLDCGNSLEGWWGHLSPC